LPVVPKGSQMEEWSDCGNWLTHFHLVNGLLRQRRWLHLCSITAIKFLSGVKDFRGVCLYLWMNVVRATGLLCLLGISVGLGSVFIYRLYTKLFSSTNAKRRRHVSDLGSSVKSTNGNLPGTLDVSVSSSVSFLWIFSVDLTSTF